MCLGIPGRIVRIDNAADMLATRASYHPARESCVMCEASAAMPAGTICWLLSVMGVVETTPPLVSI